MVDFMILLNLKGKNFRIRSLELFDTSTKLPLTKMKLFFTSFL